MNWVAIEPISDDQENEEFEPANRSKWIVAIDFKGNVSVLKAPNIHPSFFEMGTDAETLGLPFEGFEEHAGCVFEWICSFHEHKDWESGIVEDYSFEVEQEKMLYIIAV